MTSAYSNMEPLTRPMQIRFPESLMSKIDKFGVTERMPSRSAAIRTLIEKGLEEETHKK